jgi:hypothetical protein
VFAKGFLILNADTAPARFILANALPRKNLAIRQPFANMTFALELTTSELLIL